MINNRQNGRRRGRGTGQPQQNSGGNRGGAPDRGNRIDNRARGNASQLHEKYKALARDAQMQGDRVNTEFYLQFADHYFRVLSETRARFEEQRPRQNDNRQDGDYQEEADDGFYADDDRVDGETFVEADRRPPYAREERPQRDDRGQDEQRPRNDRQRDDRQRDDRPREDRPREDRPRNDQQREDRNRDDRPRSDQQRNDQQRYEQPRNEQPREERRPREQREPAPIADAVEQPMAAEERRPRRRRVEAQPANDGGEASPVERIEIDRLPPALAAEPRGDVDPANDQGDGAAPRPRRPRRPRPEAAAADA